MVSWFTFPMECDGYLHNLQYLPFLFSCFSSAIYWKKDKHGYSYQATDWFNTLHIYFQLGDHRSLIKYIVIRLLSQTEIRQHTFPDLERAACRHWTQGISFCLWRDKGPIQLLMTRVHTVCFWHPKNAASALVMITLHYHCILFSIFNEKVIHW